MDIGKTTPRLPEYRAGGASSVSKKSFRHAVRILKLSKSFKILLIERAVGFLPPAHTPRCSVSSVFCGVFQQSDMIGAFIVLTRCKRPFLLRMANGFAMPAPLPRGAGGRSTAERYWGNSDLCKLPAKRRCGHASQSAWGFSFFAPYLSRCASGAHLSYSKCADFLQELPALLQLRTGAHHANRGSFSHLIKRIRQGG